MDEEQVRLTRIEQELSDLRTLTEETHEIVRGLRRTARLSFWSRIILWALVIILPLLLIKPIINSLIPATAGNGLFGLPSSSDLQKALDMYQGQ